ncbi:glycosyltransferase [Halovivax ruber XH-70]|uniref:Glycosyltransferase n=2 Tax=Halovivax ruber TaxID=387341 RepID=L0I9Y0_HALRX|nr:glycosyltransferase [Halovivax ruber XH-70]
MVDFIQQRSYTVVHLLQVDNLLVESAIVLPDVSRLPPIVAQINGAFFGGNQNKQRPLVNKYTNRLLASPLNQAVETGLVWNKSSALVGDICLYRCIHGDVFDQILVHTSAAKEYVLDLCECTTPITVVPEPSTVEPPGFSQEYARQRIGLDPTETVLLFFGGLRKEKGIYQLLESLQLYNGPKFTLLIAGPEASATQKEIREIEKSIDPTLSLNIRYIYDSEQYFIASDGVLCPYLDEFGEERTSHVFQEALRLRRPVICPAFGSFESRLNSYNLGVLYSPNTAEGLNRAIQRFVENPEQWYSTEDMFRFYKKHSFENLCSKLLEVYRGIS